MYLGNHFRISRLNRRPVFTPIRLVRNYLIFQLLFIVKIFIIIIVVVAIVGLFVNLL